MSNYALSLRVPNDSSHHWVKTVFLVYWNDPALLSLFSRNITQHPRRLRNKTTVEWGGVVRVEEEKRRVNAAVS
eukprot:scaffold150200_cov63-Attheya_sp.AAC.1